MWPHEHSSVTAICRRKLRRLRQAPQTGTISAQKSEVFMASENGLSGLIDLADGHTNGGGTMTPGEFETMTDASEKPTKAAGRAGRTAAPRARAGAAAVPAAVTEEAPIVEEDVAKTQAAREAYYAFKQIPAPLRPIFNRLPPDEINFIVAHIDHAYRSGLAEGTASAGGSVKVACGQDHEKYNEVIATLLSAVNLLDSDRPDVAGCLKLADKAHERLVSTP